MKTNKNTPAPPQAQTNKSHTTLKSLYKFTASDKLCGADDVMQLEKVRGHRGFPFCLLSHNKEQSQQLSSWGKMNFTPQVSVEWMAAPSSLTPVQWTWAEDALLRYTETRGIFVAASAKKISRNSLWMLQNKAKTSCFYFTHRKTKIQKANKTTTQLKYILTFPPLLWLLLQTRSSKWH